MAVNVPRIKLGTQGFEVSKQGLGCLGMSTSYAPRKPEHEMIQLIHHAVNSGVTFLDTSDAYGPHTNEILVGKALKGGIREKVQIATKFGVVLKDGKMEVHGEPEYVRAACEASLKRLDVDYIDLYYVHRIDPLVPIEVTALKGGFREKVQIATKFGVVLKDGKMEVHGEPEYVRAACEASLKRLDVDCIDLYYVHRIDTRVPIEVTDGVAENGTVSISEPPCNYIWWFKELGIGIVPYSPLGKGFLSSGPKLVQNLAESDYRKVFPRFQPEHVEKNKVIYERISKMAARKGCTPSQLALAWVHHQGDDVSPIPGTTRTEHFNENIGALSVKLTPEEMIELSDLADAVEGERNVFMKSTWKYADTPLVYEPNQPSLSYERV
ncbi:UNVERIFIED_CONTAM: putative aldo-keto reductase 2 [Sesamum calycinum]|uniref:Aldo-keto reductase 2 n=2 Tax=Sesamum TaxID=4181 RepID=A0AAW2QLG1_9LAMI